MILLLDTHTLLWFLRDDPSLSPTAKALIQDPANRKLVSVASCWEVAIKAGKKKLALTKPSYDLLSRELPETASTYSPSNCDTLPSSRRCPITTETLSIACWRPNRSWNVSRSSASMFSLIPTA